MKNKFFIPASTMLASLITWIIFLILHEKAVIPNGQSLWLGTSFCLTAGGFMVFSAFSCRHVRGPRVGNFIRAVLLLVMTTITEWRAGNTETAGLALSSIVTGVLALMGTKQQN